MAERPPHSVGSQRLVFPGPVDQQSGPDCTWPRVGSARRQGLPRGRCRALGGLGAASVTVDAWCSWAADTVRPSMFRVNAGRASWPCTPGYTGGELPGLVGQNSHITSPAWLACQLKLALLNPSRIESRTSFLNEVRLSIAPMTRKARTVSSCVPLKPTPGIHGNANATPPNAIPGPTRRRSFRHTGVLPESSYCRSGLQSPPAKAAMALMRSRRILSYSAELRQSAMRQASAEES